MRVVDYVCLLLVTIIMIIILIKKYTDDMKKNKNCKQNDIVNKKNVKDIADNKIKSSYNNSFQELSFVEKNYKKIWFVFIIILFFTVIFKFGELPKYIGVDEAGMAYDAYCLSEYGTDRFQNQYPLYLTNFGQGQSSLCAYLATLCIKLFGFNEVAYRMPVLIVYLMSVVISYFLIDKAKNKKTALLFTFLIITCPWNIFNARMALDCNLFAGLFMLDLYLLNRAKRNIDFVISGIFIGLTLYTYVLSWITIPLFLFIWAVYMMYIKKIKMKHLIILGIPIFIFALPLIYFLLLNFGIVKQTQIGIFSLPVLLEFRSGEISILNIFKTGLESIKTIFTSEGTIYLMYIPLFIIGYIIEFYKMVKEVKSKEYGVSTLMVIAFTTMFIGLLTTKIPTPNKANVLYIPILYFVTIAILDMCNNSKILLTFFIVLITVSVVNYTYFFYTNDGLSTTSWYEDSHLKDITEKLENNSETKDVNKYLLVRKSSPYIYNMLALKPSPEEFNSTKEIRLFNNGAVSQISRILEYNYLYYEIEVKSIDLNKEDCVFIISNNYKEAIDYLKKNGFNSEVYGIYEILRKQ